MDSFADLHTHTAHSREADNFMMVRLNEYARAKKEMPGFEVAGVLDHDTLNYLEPMHRCKSAFAPGELPRLLPGIEITSAFDHPSRKGKVVQTHVLGYFPKLMDHDLNEIRKVEEVMGPTMRKVLQGKYDKNAKFRLLSFYHRGIMPVEDTGSVLSTLEKDEGSYYALLQKIAAQYRKDCELVEANEPKAGDIINWPVNSSDKTAIDVLVGEGIVSAEEGKLYTDRRGDDKVRKLEEVLSAKGCVDAKARAERLQGACHGDYNDPYFKISTQKAISLIAAAGGVPVLAHPMVSLKGFKDGESAFFGYCQDALLPCGLKGMEAYYPKQDALTPAIIEFCRTRGLLITGGSDDHQDGRNHIGEAGSRCPLENIVSMLR